MFELHQSDPEHKSDDSLNVYTVSELYMVSDKSPDFEETWSFLDRRMSDIGLLISAKTTVSERFAKCLLHFNCLVVF